MKLNQTEKKIEVKMKNETFYYQFSGWH